MAALGYLLLGLVAYWHLIVDGAGAVLNAAKPDPSQTVWFFAWTAHSLMCGHNPLVTTAMNAPSGYNLAQIPSMPLLGALALPITVLAGPLVSVKVFFVLAMPLSAASAFWVLRRWGVWEPAAALGGLIYGFSPYMVDQGAYHLHLVFVPLPPLIASLVARSVVSPAIGRDRRAKRTLALAGLVVAQYLIAAEVLAMTAVLCIAGLFIAGMAVALRYGARSLVARKAPLLDLVAASLLAGVLLAYPIWLEFLGPQHYTGPAWPANNPWYADVLSLFAPGPWQAVAPFLRAQGSALAVLTGDETVAYLGFGVVIVTGLVAWVARRSIGVRLSGALAVVSLVLSLGPTLVVDRRADGIPLPFAVITHVPGLDSILPIRLAFLTGASIAVLVAFGLSEVHGRGEVLWFRGLRHPAGAVTAVVALIFIVTWLPSWPYPASVVSTPPRSLISSVRIRDPITLTYPFAATPQVRPLLWQATGRFDFRIVGGYAYRPTATGQATLFPPFLAPTGVEEFLTEEYFGHNRLVPVPPSYRAVKSELPTFLAHNHVSAVLIDASARHAGRVEKLVASVLGAPSARSGQFLMWAVPD